MNKFIAVLLVVFMACAGAGAFALKADLDNMRASIAATDAAVWNLRAETVGIGQKVDENTAFINKSIRDVRSDVDHARADIDILNKMIDHLHDQLTRHMYHHNALPKAPS